MRAGYAFCRMTSQIFFRLMYGLRIVGMENLPRTGKVIVASNHRSNYDPPILGGTLPRETHFFAKSELFEIPLLGRLIRYLNAFPVKRGEFDRLSLETCIRVLKNDGLLLFFPEGTRAPVDGFLEAKLGVGWVVCLSDAPVVPVYIHGSTERYLQIFRRPAITMVVGSPVPAQNLKPEGLRGRDLYQAVADKILDYIRELSLTTPYGRVKEKGRIYSREIIDNERLR
jgi:1-acyl-sn-glycerol-3-phosphate acyltransferase